MLSPHEFSIGYISDAVGLALVLSRRREEIAFIVVTNGSSKVAIMLDGEHRFTSFECDNNTTWGGIVIPNISIEIDESSMADHAPRGSLIRTGTTLAMATRESTGEGQRVALLSDLPPCHASLTASFTRWRVVIGDGLSKRELKKVEIT